MDWDTIWDPTNNQIILSGRITVQNDNYLGGAVAFNLSSGNWTSVNYHLQGESIKYLGRDGNETYIFGNIRSPAIGFLVCTDDLCFGPRK